MSESLTAFSYAHGRINLMGEHTDYNGGFVLPTSILQKTLAQLKIRTDMQVSIESYRPLARGEKEAPPQKTTYLLGQEKPKQLWSDCFEGLTAVLKKQGFRISGFDARIDSSIPMGYGLASSAALLTSLCKALRKAFALNLTDFEIAQISQRVENEFVGSHVGLIEAMACSLIKNDEILFIDSSDYAIQSLPRPKDLALIVMDSGVRDPNAHAVFNQRRRECSEAARLLKVQCLSDIQLGDLQVLDPLPETLKRRARHVITENARVLEAVTAIQKSDFDKLGRLFELSHFSQRDDYGISVEEVDQLVNIALGTYGVYGARLTGCGSGGAVLICAEQARCEEIVQKIAWVYHSAVGKTATVLSPPLTVQSNARQSASHSDLML